MLKLNDFIEMNVPAVRMQLLNLTNVASSLCLASLCFSVCCIFIGFLHCLGLTCYDFAFRLCLQYFHDHMMFRFMIFLLLRIWIYAEAAGENKWKDMKGNWKDNGRKINDNGRKSEWTWEERERKMKTIPVEADIQGLRSGFWYPLTLFDKLFGYDSDINRYLE